MSFSADIIYPVKKIKRTLQVPRKINAGWLQIRSRSVGLQKRIRFSAFGSLTVEAALVLPIFVLVLAGILCMGQIFYLQTRIQTAMEQTGEELATYYYGVKSLSGDTDGEEGKQSGLDAVLGDFAKGIASAVFAKNRILEAVGREWLDNSLIEGGSDGLSMAGSTFFQEDDRVNLTVRYRIKIPYLDFLKPLTVVQTCVRRAWTGTGGGTETGEEIVYITDTGTVYHVSLDCTYLRPSLEEVRYGEVEHRRNESGERYRACEKCAASGQQGIPQRVYITKYGNRYHFSVACPALTRGIRTIKKSEAAGRLPCSKCGMQEGTS